MQFRSFIIVMVVWCGYMQSYQTAGGGALQKSVSDSKVTKSRAIKLCEAIKVGDIDYLNSWISKGRTLNIFIGKKQYTPLHLAVIYVQPAMVQKIIGQGVPLDKSLKDSAAFTPLHCAVQRGSLEVVTMLVEAGAPLGSFSRKHHNPHCLALNFYDKALENKKRCVADSEAFKTYDDLVKTYRQITKKFLNKMHESLIN